jgi:hypothetical protein
MSIPVVCSGCKARLNAPDTAAGKKVKCPKCQGAIVVPEPEAAGDFEVVDDEPAPPAEKARPKAKAQAVADEGGEEDEKPRKKKKAVVAEAEEDEKPRAKKARAVVEAEEDGDAEEDEKPKKKKGDPERGEKDGKPRKKKKKRDEEGGTSMTRHLIGGVALVILTAVAAAIFYVKFGKKEEVVVVTPSDDSQPVAKNPGPGPNPKQPDAKQPGGKQPPGKQNPANPQTPETPLAEATPDWSWRIFRSNMAEFSLRVPPDKFTAEEVNLPLEVFDAQLAKSFGKGEHSRVEYSGKGFSIQIDRLPFAAGLDAAAKERAFADFAKAMTADEVLFKVTSQSEVTVAGVKGREEKFEGEGMVGFRRYFRTDTSAYYVKCWGFERSTKAWLPTMVISADSLRFTRDEKSPKPAIDAAAWQTVKPPRCNFQVSMPGKPLLASSGLKARQIDDGSAVIVHVGPPDQPGSQVFVAGCVIHKKGTTDSFRESQRKELEVVLAGYGQGVPERRNQVGAKNLKWEELTLDRTRRTVPGATVMRIASSGDYEYFLAASGYEGLPPKDVLDKFFDSFELVK